MSLVVTPHVSAGINNYIEESLSLLQQEEEEEYPDEEEEIERDKWECSLSLDDADLMSHVLQSACDNTWLNSSQLGKH